MGGFPYEVEQHGDWLIWHAPLPIEWRGADWHFARVGARDSVDIGDEESRAMCLQTIDWLEEQEREDERGLSPEAEAGLQRCLDTFWLMTHNRRLREALDRAISAIRDAEKDTNWTSGDPYGESLADELERVLASADRSGEADETSTKIGGSAEGESAVPAKQGDAQ